jgi:hypothetical protein
MSASTIPSAKRLPLPREPVNTALQREPPERPGQRIWRILQGQASFVAVAFQFLLLVFLVREFHLESRTFSRLLVLMFAGFLIHHYLPDRWRLPFFALLSVAATIRVLHFPFGLVPVAIGLVLIGICHLPVAFWGRLALLASVGAGLTLARVYSEWFPALESMWPILGSMFIFRLLTYLYDLKHSAAPFGPARAVSYFFMLPNVCFPLFPVVDYKTFCGTHYNEQAPRIYQSGIRWMLRGIVQLVLYRVIYHYARLDITSVADLKGVAEYVVATYLLYLHVSGQFHLIVGLLHMFGFNLPETHHRYLLASSFTDFWRRINIYWKDFIMKLFFYPAFFALRGVGTLKAIALATLVAFFATWALHSWQWFWFRGRVLFSWQDTLFWSILAVLVLVNALQEALSGRRRSLSKPRFNWRSRLVIGVKTVGTFAVICGLWTLWSCQSTAELQILAESAVQFSIVDFAVIGAGIGALCLAAMLWGGSTREDSQGQSPTSQHSAPFHFWHSAAANGLGAASLLLLLPALDALEKPAASRFANALRLDQVNASDLDSQRRGYYEELDMVRTNYRAWEGAREAPPGWSSENLYRPRTDFLGQDMAPSVSGMFCGAPGTTNRWGMRDRDYEKEKPTGVYRIVLLGSSHEVGSGVRDDETFENIVEDRLNQATFAGDVPKLEILNLAVGGYGVLRKLGRLEYDGLEFSPDAVLFSVNSGDRVFDLGDMTKIVRSKRPVPFDFLNVIFQQARVDARLEDLVIRHRLQPYVPDMFAAAFGRLRQQCDARGIRCFVLYRPMATDPAQIEPARRSEVLRLAREARLEVLDLSAAFDNVHDRDSLVLTPWDDHTNALGHRLLADVLYEQLAKALTKDPNTVAAE